MIEMTDYYIQQLRHKNIVFEQGLSHREIELTEKIFHVSFPPDLKLFLQTALPVSQLFVHWRAGLNLASVKKEIVLQIQWPWDGLVFDLEHDNYWHETWGEIPDSLEQRIDVARQYFMNYSPLVPIYAHRYIPSQPYESDNPVFSVYQMDIIYYGYNLADYFAREFHFNLPSSLVIPQEPKYIKFWSDHT
jgi:hypothetical protein